jgi:hypothetical protein
MSWENVGSRFVIFSLPRSGSTTLARLLNAHKDIRCLVEPFHPKRYGGKLNALSTNELSLDSVLETIWSRWNGIKHVWESNGWPFRERPKLNGHIALGANRSIVFIIRRNLLRRAVSNYISRQTQYWIGTRAEFVKHLDRAELGELDPAVISRQIRADQRALADYSDSFSRNAVRVTTLYYEDMFCETASRRDQFQFINTLLAFLQFDSITWETFVSIWERHFDPSLYRWASPDVYRRIPGIDRIEEEIGSDQTGWLFH